MHEGRVRQPGSDTKVYAGSSNNLTDMASKAASAKGEDMSACKRRKCLRRAPDESIERFGHVAGLGKEWSTRICSGPSRCGVDFP